MILVGIGANLPSFRFGAPLRTCEAAILALSERQISVKRTSPWYRTAAMPASDQPDFVNGVAVLESKADPEDLLGILHEIEAAFGRTRKNRNDSRVLDLDLLAYYDRVIDGEDGLCLPHPRMAQRAFVLMPLRDVAPGWRYPVLGRTVEAMIEDLPPGQAFERLP